jgi:hypothetical protein
MYGKYVTYKGYKIWINCVPSTSEEELQARAARKLNRYLSGEIYSLAY